MAKFKFAPLPKMPKSILIKPALPIKKASKITTIKAKKSVKSKLAKAPKTTKSSVANIAKVLSGLKGAKLSLPKDTKKSQIATAFQSSARGIKKV